MPQPQPFVAPPMPPQQGQYVPPRGDQQRQPHQGQSQHGQPQQGHSQGQQPQQAQRPQQGQQPQQGQSQQQQQQQQQRAPPVRQQRPPQQRRQQPAPVPTLHTATGSSSNTSRIVELSNSISYNTAVLDAHLTNFNQHAYSFSRDAPADRERLIPAMEARRKAIEDASLELHELVQHPRSLTMDSPSKHAAKAFIAKFEIAKRVPPNGDISYGTLSELTGVDQSALETILRLAIAHRIFNESEQERGRIAHSPASRWLAEDSAVQAGKAFADDFLPMTAALAVALERFPQANDPTHSAAAITIGGTGEGDFYQLLDRFPQRQTQIAHALQAAREVPGLSLDHLIAGFEWGSLPRGALCVDIGGGRGETAFALAAAFPHLNWIVQDTWEVLRDPPAVPKGMNVAFMGQDFLEVQSHVTRGAKVFLLRRFLHHWPDAYCSQILRGLIPSLEYGSRVLVMERMLKAPGAMASNGEERAVRARALEQLALSNGRERDREGWRRVVIAVDPTYRRLRLERWRELEASDLGIIELVWTGTGQVDGGVAAGQENAATASGASDQGHGYGQQRQVVNEAVSGNGNMAAAPVGHGQGYGTMVGVLTHESAAAPPSGRGQGQAQRTASGELRGANVNMNGSPAAAHPAGGQGQEMRGRAVRNEDAAAALVGLGQGQQASSGVVRNRAAWAATSGHAHASEAMDGVVSNILTAAAASGRELGQQTSSGVVTDGAAAATASSDHQHLLDALDDIARSAVAPSAPWSHVREQRMADVVGEYRRAATAPLERVPGQETMHGVVENRDADAVPSGSAQGHEMMQGVVESGPSTLAPAGGEQGQERMDEAGADELSTRPPGGSWPGVLNGGVGNPPTSPWGRRDWERMMGEGQ